MWNINRLNTDNVCQLKTWGFCFDIWILTWNVALTCENESIKSSCMQECTLIKALVRILWCCVFNFFKSLVHVTVTLSSWVTLFSYFLFMQDGVVARAPPVTQHWLHTTMLTIQLLTQDPVLKVMLLVVGQMPEVKLVGWTPQGKVNMEQSKVKREQQQE